MRVSSFGNSNAKLVGDIAGMSTAVSPQELQIISSSVEIEYQRFKELVAKGRKMTLDQVNHVAEGQVWTGVQAKQNGLVDRNDTFLETVNKLAKGNQVLLVTYSESGISSFLKSFLKLIPAQPMFKTPKADISTYQEKKLFYWQPVQQDDNKPV